MGKTLLTPRHSLNAFFRSPSQLNLRTSGSQQKLTAHFAFSSIHKLKFDVYHETRQTSQLFSPDQFRCGFIHSTCNTRFSATVKRVRCRHGYFTNLMRNTTEEVMIIKHVLLQTIHAQNTCQVCFEMGKAICSGY